MWDSPLAAEAPAVVKETILERGQTTSVSIPSALLLEAGAGAEAGAGLLLSRAGTVKERRPLCSGGGACPGVLEGASGDDMMAAHACIARVGVSFTEHKRCGCALLAVESLVEAENWRALLFVHLARSVTAASFTGSTALQISITEKTESTQAITAALVLAPCSRKRS